MTSHHQQLMPKCPNEGDLVQTIMERLDSSSWRPTVGRDGVCEYHSNVRGYHVIGFRKITEHDAPAGVLTNLLVELLIETMTRLSHGSRGGAVVRELEKHGRRRSSPTRTSLTLSGEGSFLIGLLGCTSA